MLDFSADLCYNNYKKKTKEAEAVRLLVHGMGVQSKDWHVREQEAAGYSRVYYILSGEVTYCDATLKKRLECGRLYVFPTQSPYRIDHNRDRPIDCLWFHMDMFPYDVPCLLELDPTDPTQKTLYGLLEALICEKRNGRENEQLYPLLTEALSLLICRDPSVKRPDPIIVKILEYIRENAASPTLNIGSISKRFGYSTAHFIRVFRAGLGMTPYRYISLLRLSAATRLLLDGVSVCETSAACGYTDVKTFSRAFKKNYGVSPSSYATFYRSQA